MFVRGNIRSFLILLLFFATISLPKAVFAEVPCHIYINDDSPLPQISYVGYTALGTYILKLHPGIKTKGKIKQYTVTLTYSGGIRLEHVEGAGFCVFDVNNKVTLNAYSNEECKFRLNVTSLYPTTINADITLPPLDGDKLNCIRHIKMEIIDLPSPQFRSMTPSSGIRGDSVVIGVSKLEGNYFDAGTKVKLVKGPNTINVTNLNIVNHTNITFKIPLTATTPIGSWDVVITNSKGLSMTKPGAFTVEAPKPKVTGLSVHQGPMEGTGTSIKITGTGLTEATKVSFGVVGDVAGSRFSVVSSNEIIVTSPVCTRVTNAIVDVTVTTPGGTSAENPQYDQFTYYGVPNVGAITPAYGSAAGGTTDIIIGGSNFGTDKANVKVYFGDNQADVTAVTDDKITVTSPPGAAGTSISVKVITPGGGPVAATNQFAYYDPGAAPIITGVTPSYGKINIETPVEIVGTNFIPGAPTTVKFGNAGSVTGTVVDSTHIIATSPAYGIAETLDVTVTTLVGTSMEVSADKFTYYGVPTVGTISPISGSTVGGTTVTIDGSNFGKVMANVAVYFGDNQADVTAVADNKITVISPPGDAGSVNVKVTTPGGEPVTAKNKFTYIPPPTVTAITQNVGSIIQPTRNYIITGTDFIPGSGFGVELVGSSGATINVTAVSATKITCTIDLSSAKVGLYDVQVTNSDKQTGTLYKGFVINNNAAASPNIGSISPNNASQGATVDGIVLKGINFVNGATVQLVNSGNTIEAKVTFVGSTELICSVTILPSAVTGFWNVVVINPDGQIGLLAKGFIVNKDANAPTINSITKPNPAVGTQGTTITGVILEGTNFAVIGKTKIQLQQAGVIIPADTVSVVDEKHITCNITLSITVSGLWDAVVVNPDEQIALLAKAFQVNLKWNNHSLGNKVVTGVYALGSGYTTAIYAATGNAGGVWISLDNAASWIHRTSGNSGLVNDYVSGICALVFGGITTIYAATGGGLSVSANVGASWTNYLLSDIVTGVYVLDNHIYAVTTDHLFVSNDSGISWINHNTFGSDLSSDSAIAIYVATAIGFFTGYDNTTSWKRYLQDIVYKIHVSGNNIYLATIHGLFVSTDNGATWVNYTASGGLADDVVNGVYAIDNYIYAATDGGLSVTSGGP